MSDQCRFCTLKDNAAACDASGCHKLEDGIVVRLRAELEAEKAKSKTSYDAGYTDAKDLYNERVKELITEYERLMTRYERANRRSEGEG